MKFTQQDSEESILYDAVFFTSKDIYYQTVKRFISKELPVEELVSRVSFQCLSSLKECKLLESDFPAQSKLEFDPKISQFSTVIYDLCEIVQDFHDGVIPENQLRQLVKNDVLPKLQKYFIN